MAPEAGRADSDDHHHQYTSALAITSLGAVLGTQPTGGEDVNSPNVLVGQIISASP